MLLEFRSGARLASIEVGPAPDGVRVALDGAPLAVELLGAKCGELELRIDGRRRRAYVAQDGAVARVCLDGRVFAFVRHTGDEEVAEALVGDPRVTAPLPGKVVKVLVVPGQSVTAGEPLLILEAMKMETEIAAPLSGKVASVHVPAGGTVALGDPLVDIAPPAAAADPGPATGGDAPHSPNGPER
jgi:3-methylcrotonyl-CoA carboxylase alpha subunit